MIKVPKYVRTMLKRTEVELERELFMHPELRNSDNLFRLSRIREILTDDGEEVIDYIEAMNIMESIIDCCADLTEEAVQCIFVEVKIEKSLEKALKTAKELHPRMEKEIEEFESFLEDSPNCNFQFDIYDRVKTFKLVRTRKDWERLKENEDLQSIPDFKHLKIGYLAQDPQYYNYNEKNQVREARKYLIEMVGFDGFEEIRDSFERWFGIVRKGTFYVYVPK